LNQLGRAAALTLRELRLSSDSFSKIAKIAMSIE
jgi:hypothetical protein